MTHIAKSADRRVEKGRIGIKNIASTYTVKTYFILFPIYNYIFLSQHYDRNIWENISYFHFTSAFMQAITNMCHECKKHKKKKV